MKTCPRCSFANGDEFPTCVFCNEPLMDVPSVPSPDPASPEHEEKALRKMRNASFERQLRFAVIVYAVAITVTAGVADLGGDPPQVHPLMLACFFVTAILVAMAIARRLAGQFLGSLGQGGLSVWLLLSFGCLNPITFFLIAAHACLPLMLSIWIELIYDMNR